jgi:hypothetical protein
MKLPNFPTRAGHATMMKGIPCIGLMTVIALVGMGSPGFADETGLADIHTLVRVGHKICMADHFHNGTGTGASRKEALAAAISDWASFTTLEYGTSWGQFGLAASKGMACSKASQEWNCNIEARPCRRG